MADAKQFLEPTPVLDKGFVRLVDSMGGDERIVQAARVSYGKGTKSAREDANLIDYLMRHRHTSPFEQVVLTFHLKMPIFVARQWIRHRTARLNEISGRYSIMEDAFYVPESERVKGQDTVNKQGSNGKLLMHPTAFTKATEMQQEQQYASYEQALEMGVARELARINLPLSLYTEMYWQIDLHNLFHFLALRLDSHAQWEIREYARAIADAAQAVAPIAYQAFERHRLNAVTLSSDEMAILKQCLGADMVREQVEQSDLRPSRQRELLAKLGMVASE
jgi:thymidylate synthase (FAD)